MTTLEAKESICKEFISRYYEWLKDVEEMPEREYGEKYCWGKPQNVTKDNMEAVKFFQKYMFAGRFLPAWEKAGYDKQTIWQLHRDGFLSYDYNSSWQARMMGKQDFYYISQARAKEIYKAYK